MGNLAQYITVFMANLTSDPGTTPDCYADRHSLCNNISCTEPATGQSYNFSLLPCNNPIGLSISRGFAGDGGATLGELQYNASQAITVLGRYSAMLTLNTLSTDTVQIGVRLTDN